MPAPRGNKNAARPPKKVRRLVVSVSLTEARQKKVADRLIRQGQEPSIENIRKAVQSYVIAEIDNDEPIII